MFMKLNGIRHITSAPYHPATNGLAERFVQTLKQGLRAFADAPISLQQKLANVLFAYRNATHATTNRTPAMLFLGRGLRSRLDLLKPNLRRTVMDRQIKQGKGTHNRETRQLEIGQTVLARDYRGEHKWIPGIIRERQGPLSYTVEVAPDTIWRRHLDQLRGSEVRTAAEMVDPAASFIAAQGDLSLPTASATPETMSLPSSTAGQDSRNLQSSDSDMGCLPSPGPPLTPRIGLPRAGASPAVTPERPYPMRTHRPPKRLSF
ncbi:unnamed protein product [Knipowitschia caucasica]